MNADDGFEYGAQPTYWIVLLFVKDSGAPSQVLWCVCLADCVVVPPPMAKCWLSIGAINKARIKRYTGASTTITHARIIKLALFAIFFYNNNNNKITNILYCIVLAAWTPSRPLDFKWRHYQVINRLAIFSQFKVNYWNHFKLNYYSHLAKCNLME